ncbi:MAG: winged helix-turn-helix domain-containing protein [Candidatus Dormibacteraeota bacterium]|nr:winged helix-turn-helix domain-containing protein [Candidatus Dormibacteraeota bacterium]
MSFLQAAVTVLEIANRPMTSREINDEALRRGLVRTTGRTPLKTMDAALYTHLKRATAPSLVRLNQPGKQRAKRGSVRWILADRE